MAGMGQIGKKAKQFGNKHQKRHRISYQDTDTAPLVHAKRLDRSAVSQSADSTFTTDSPSQNPSSSQPSSAGLIEGVVELPTVTVRRAASKDDDTDASQQEELTPETLADLVYKKLVSDSHLLQLRQRGRNF